jgi:hypothetical protein
MAVHGIAQRHLREMTKLPPSQATVWQANDEGRRNDAFTDGFRTKCLGSARRLRIAFGATGYLDSEIVGDVDSIGFE